MKFKIFSQLMGYFLSMTLVLGQVVYAQDQLKSGPSVDGEGASLFKFDMNQDLGIMQFVKFVVYLDDAKNPQRLVFQNTDLYPFHSDYLMTTKEFAGKNRVQIDELTLKDSPDRKAILGTLFNHMQQEQADKDNVILHSFELVTDDVMPVKTVQAIQQLVLKSSPETIEGKSLAYLASGKNKKNILDQTEVLKAAGVKVYDVFKNKSYQAYVKGWNVGQVKIIRAAEMDAWLKAGEITPETILVTDQVPREIPPIRGLISVEPTAMSSHVALLAEMFQIPFAADKNIMNKAQSLDGKKVYINIDHLGIGRFIAIDDQTYQRLLKIKSPKPLAISVDYSKTQILQTKDLKDSDISAYGGKSVRLGLLKRQIPANAPEHSVAIPVAYFKKYIDSTMTSSGALLKDVINSHIQKIQTGQLNYAEISTHLAEIRKVIKETKVPNDIVKDVHGQISKFIPNTVERVKLRSSSNVEDGSEFNGAGLYDSEGVWLNNAPQDKAEDFAKGLNKVWRSFYSDRGFLARQAFQVDESKAAMGILVQETFKNELANGVSLYLPAQHQWSQDEIKVIGFPGEETSVTNPTTPDQPEIVELNANVDNSKNPPIMKWVIDIKQRTNLLPIGQSIMAEVHYKQLAALMHKISKNWNGGVPKSGLDFEWKLIEKNGLQQILIKQVRPLVQTQKENLPNGAKHFIIGGFEEELEIGYQESDAAFGQHFCPEKVSIQFPSFADNEIQNSILIPLVKISLRGKDYEFKNVKATGNAQVNNNIPEFNLDFMLDTDVYKGLRFSFVNPYNSEGGIVDQYRGSVRGSVTDLQQAKGVFEDVERYVCFLGTPFELGDQSTVDVSWADSYLSAQIKANEGTVSIDAFYKSKSGMDKTAHYIINETIIEGFGLKKPLKINVPRASVYGGAHHNFSWGVSIDMEAADLTADEKQAFYKKYGRYLMYSSTSFKNQTQAYWLKPDGKLSKPFKATWTSKLK